MENSIKRKRDPFAWQDKKTLRFIQKHYKGIKLSQALALYLTISQLSSDRNDIDVIDEYGIKIMEMSGLGRDSIRILLNDFHDIGIINLEKGKLTMYEKRSYSRMQITILEKIDGEILGLPSKSPCKRSGKKSLSKEKHIEETIEENIEYLNNENSPKTTKPKIIQLAIEKKEEMFNDYWKIYPNKQGKAKSLEWYKKNITEELHKQIVKGVNAYKRTTEESKARKQFTPEYKHSTTFLNGKCREDYTSTTEDEAFREAYEKSNPQIYSGWCKDEIGKERSINEKYYVPYNDLTTAIRQKNNEWEGHNAFISTYQTKWKK